MRIVHALSVLKPLLGGKQGEEEYGEAAAGWAQFVLGLNGAITFPLFPSFLASFHAYEGKDEY